MGELLSLTRWVLIGAIAWAIPGYLCHEVDHRVFGGLFGGGPSFRKFLGPFPTQVDFESPKNLENWQVRLTGGFVLIFPYIAIVGLLVRSIPLIFFGLGGSGISTTDMMAFRYPEAWKKFTAGEPITREDFEKNSNYRRFK